MTKRMQVLFDDEEYRGIQRVARECHMTVAEWVRQSLREARLARRSVKDAKLRAVDEATRHSYPVGDIDTMLREIEAVACRSDLRRLQCAVDPAIASLDAITDEVLPIQIADIRVARELIASVTGISARDALHAAVMRHAGIERIFSLDRGFDACPGRQRLG